MKIKEEVIDKYDFACPYCESEKLDIKPLDIPYTMRADNDNSDIKDEKIRKYYDSIPFIGKVLMECSTRDMIVHCGDCNICSMIDKQLIRTDLLSYLKRKNLEPQIVLQSKK